MERTAQVVSVRSDGKKFTYNSDTWGMLSMKGFDFNEIETKKSARGLGDGDIITSQRRISREMTVVAKPRSIKYLDTERARALSFHNLKYTFDLYVTYLGRTKIAKGCRLQTPAFPTENVYKPSQLTAVYICGDPDLYADSEDSVNMSKITARWKLPRVYLADTPLPFSTEERADSKIITYEGTMPAPLKITLTATGYLKGINITVGTHTAHIDIEMTEGQVLIVDSSKSFATLDGALVSYAKSGNYDFRNMVVDFGDVEVSITADTGTSYRTEIKYTGRYEGL